MVLCDTNGGTLPHEVSAIMGKVMEGIDRPVGIHAHNDCGLALANSLAAVQAGATMVQGTVNGYGERCGNTDLIAVIGNLQLKMGYLCIPPEKIKRLTELSRYVSEVANMPPVNQRPFVGKSAFAHKGGVHVSAILKDPRAYEHMDPEAGGQPTPRAGLRPLRQEQHRLQGPGDGDSSSARTGSAATRSCRRSREWRTRDISSRPRKAPWSSS